MTNYNALIIISNTAQIEMFKRIISNLKDFNIKFVNTEIFQIKEEIENYLTKYELNYINISDWSMKSVEKILRSENPDIILSGHDQSPMDILFIKAGNGLNIPSLTVQDGLLAAVRFVDETVNSKVEYFFKMLYRFFKLFFNPYRTFNYKISRLRFELYYGRDYNYNYGHGESSKIALFGDNTKNLLVSEGVPSEKLVVTGSSKFDDLLEFKDPVKQKLLREKYGISSKRKVVLVLTSWFVEARLWTVEERRFFITEIVKACNNLGDIQLVIKLHAPHESIKDYQEILEDYPVSALIFDFESLHELICISDVVVSVSSTAALEAMALDKPVLIVNMDYGSKIFKDSGAMFIEKTDSFESALEKLLFHTTEFLDRKRMHEFVYDEAYLVDGKASVRISDLIRSMVMEYIKF